MIITVTMNPAIDKTIEIENFEVGTLNRIISSVSDVGGKGINVSKTINAIKGETLATGFVGGKTGELIKETLENLGIRTDFVNVESETRINTKVFAKNTGITELNEQGATVTKEKLDELVKKLVSYADENTIFVLAGSVPNGVPKDIYKTITLLVKEKGSRVVLDADGDLFKNSLTSLPDVIKPNREELAEYAGIKGKPTVKQIVEIAEQLVHMGIKTVAVSMGKDGSVFINQNEKYQCPTIDVEVFSTVGAGDAMVAGIAYAMDKDYTFKNTIRLSAATSTGAVTTKGTRPPSYELVVELKNLAKIIEIGE